MRPSESGFKLTVSRDGNVDRIQMTLPQEITASILNRAPSEPPVNEEFLRNKEVVQIEGVELDEKTKELCFYIEFINNQNRKVTRKCWQKDCELIERMKGKDYVFDYLKKCFLSMNNIDVK